MGSQRPSAYAVYLALTGLSAFCFAMLSTVSGVYAVKAAGLNPLQLVLVGTTLEASAFLLEAPTGVVADVYSRKLSVIIGFFLFGAGFLLWGAFTRFETILIAQVIWGAGYTFTSGATEAWIADEVGEARAGAVFLRGAQAGQVAGIGGIVVSVALASLSLHLPLLVAGAGLLALGAALLPLMPETGFAPLPRGDRTNWQRWSHTLLVSLRTVRGKPVLITILAISAILGASSEGYDRLKEAHLINDIGLPALGAFDPVVWFGLIGIGGMLLSLIAAEIVRRRVDTTSHVAVARVLCAVNALLIGAVVAFGLAGSFALALAAWWATTLLRRTNGPLNTIWLNQNLEPGVRATVFSLNSQADALGQIVVGPAVGALAAGVSVRVGLIVAGALIAPALLLYARTMRAHGATPALAAE